MARTEKIDNSIKKRFLRRESKRNVDVRNKKVYFLIICEGEKTEPFYFKAIERKLPFGTMVVKIQGTGRNTLDLISYTIKQRDISCRQFDRVWVVFDKDDFTDENFNSAIDKANKNDINCAWSNEAFELWYLLHFQFIDTGLSRDQYKKYLEREIRKRSGNQSFIYKKNDPQMHDLLSQFGSIERATEFSKRLRRSFSDTRYGTHNPCTLVYELIDELFNPGMVLDNQK